MEIFSRLFSRQNCKLSLIKNNKDSANTNLQIYNRDCAKTDFLQY